MLMMVVDALLSRVIARGPTVLVVDDVQWADPATWDALSYLVAGFGHQRLALVTTHRDEAAVSEHFQHWLGNVRRLPGTEELVLTRLDEDATGDQIAVLLGRPPPPRLVEQVYERSRGNPYFSELLVRRGDLDSAELPEDLPDELSQALLDAWRSMSAPAREITRILAIAGRPTDLRSAGRRCRRDRRLRQPRRSARPSTRESSCSVRDGAWFRHPLLAGVLAESYLPGEAAPVHAAWAAHLESVSDRGRRRAAPARRPRLPPRAGRRRRPRRSPHSSRVPTSPRSSARVARPPTCWSGRPTCGRWLPTPPTPSATHGCSSAPAMPACGSGGRSDGYRLLRCGTRPRLPRAPPALGEQARGAGGEDRVRHSARPGTIRSASSSEPWSSPGSSPTAASTPRPWPSLPTPCSGSGGPTRHDGWSRTPWRQPTARVPPRRSAWPMASVPMHLVGERLRAGGRGRDGLLGAGFGLG